jgi:hypothetical protein
MKNMVDESARSKSDEDAVDGQRRALLKKASLLFGVVSLSGLAAMTEASARTQRCGLHLGCESRHAQGKRTPGPTKVNPKSGRRG